MRKSMFAVLALVAIAPPLAARPNQPHVAVKTADYSFSYDYPAQAAAIPPLAAWFEADRTRARAAFAKDAAEARRDAKTSGYPFNGYEMTVEWKVVTDTPRLLSLSSLHWAFTGGAHGNGGSGALVWDKARKQRLQPIALFTSPDALWSALRASYCRALDAERTKRRGEPVGKTGNVFDACPPFKDLTLLLGSTDRKSINRIGLIADAYVAGSYAEGQYDITLPVTPAVLAAVKPDYRAAFAVKAR